MKKATLFSTIIIICILLASCTHLKHAITGEIIDPVGDFSQGSDNKTLVYCGNNYVLVEEIDGDFYINTSEEDVILGQTSNFPFFPNFNYYANAVENPEYLLSGSATNSTAACVYLREDLYQSPLCYVLQGTDYEFDFSSAFIATDEVSYKKHVEGKSTYGADIYFYVKDYPRLTVDMRIYKLNGEWYYVKSYKALKLSDPFLEVLRENDLIPE